MKDVHFRDDIYWDTADDFHRTLYTELLKLVENDPEHGHLTQSEIEKATDSYWKSIFFVPTHFSFIAKIGKRLQTKPTIDWK